MKARFATTPLAIGLAACLALALAALIWPVATAQGWRIAFIVWSSAPIGAVVLSLIHVLTGGRWGDACQPTVRASALGAALLPLFFMPILVALNALYPWARDPTSVAPDVARLYLNAPGFALRGLVALVGWATLGRLAAAGRLSPLGAALALVVHGVAISLVAVDWVLSSTPHVTDSAFATEIAVQQIVAALAMVTVLQPGRAIIRAGSDVGGLLLAASLGGLYLALMTFIVKWYGDQAEDAAYYLVRAQGVWRALLLGALALAAGAPILGLPWTRLRMDPTALRAIGAATLFGVALHDEWLMGPDAPAGSAIAAALALIAMGGLSFGLAPWLARRVRQAKDAPLARGAVNDR